MSADDREKQAKDYSLLIAHHTLKQSQWIVLAISAVVFYWAIGAMMAGTPSFLNLPLVKVVAAILLAFGPQNLLVYTVASSLRKIHTLDELVSIHTRIEEQGK